MTDSSEWVGPVGSAWAQEWMRTDRSFAGLTDRLLDAAAIDDFSHGLDIGCGAGELVERLAAAHPRARVTGLDISAELLAVARARCARWQNARFALCDAAQWRAPPGEALDLLVSRHGVMFFADPAGAFAHLRAQCRPGATLRFSCFRARAENAWATTLEAALGLPRAPADPGAPGPFAFADRARVTAILGAAGWAEIGFEPVDYPMIAGQGAGATEEALAYFQRIGPAARALREMPARERPAALDRLRAVIGAHHEGGRVALDAAAWIVTARAP